MLLNLYSNALKYTFKNKVTLVVEKLTQGCLRISVIDKGLGIKKQNQKKMFQMFGTIKDKKYNPQGIGLGLVISKQIVGKFGGEIRFFSKYRQGTTFFFTFCLAKVDEEDLQQMELSIQSF